MARTVSTLVLILAFIAVLDAAAEVEAGIQQLETQPKGHFNVKHDEAAAAAFKAVEVTPQRLSRDYLCVTLEHFAPRASHCHISCEVR